MSAFLRIGGWVIAMIAIVLAGLLGQQLKAARAERDAIAQQLAARNKQVEDMVRLEKEAKAKSNALQQELEETIAAMDVPEGESGLITEDGALAGSDAPESAPAPPTFFDHLAGMMKGERGAALAKSSSNIQARAHYGKLFKELNLPPDVEERAIGVVAAKYESEMLAGVDMLSGGTVDPEKAKQEGAEADKRMREELSTILSPDELAQYDEYQAELPRHVLEQQFEMQLTMFGSSLPEESRTLITQTLVEETLSVMPDFGKPGSNANTNPASIFETQLTVIDRARERLAAELDENEFAQAERFLNQQQEQMRTFTELMSGMMPGPKDPKSPKPE
jgi:hypothetical protein